MEESQQEREARILFFTIPEYASRQGIRNYVCEKLREQISADYDRNLGRLANAVNLPVDILKTWMNGEKVKLPQDVEDKRVLSRVHRTLGVSLDELFPINPDVSDTDYIKKFGRKKDESVGRCPFNSPSCILTLEMLTYAFGKG